MNRDTRTVHLLRRLALPDVVFGDTAPGSTEFNQRLECCARMVLLQTPGLGDRRIRFLMHRFSTAVGVLTRTRRELQAIRGIGNQISDRILSFRPAHFDSDRFWRRATVLLHEGARLSARGDVAWPAVLEQLDRPPGLLWGM